MNCDENTPEGTRVKEAKTDKRSVVCTKVSEIVHNKQYVKTPKTSKPRSGV